ncbi:hypothetical protein GCM10010497_13960 [Streptomyces cinereoruber]|uniref:DUF305 domain-containing protein n=1 Tax=Streptomyces cinereoruber TaxID=67260 RepID=A0AAV4KE05_9ACTN|nr:hypothetical protein GCM10010497_13960 [Streptomyces cinereoruber]
MGTGPSLLCPEEAPPAPHPAPGRSAAREVGARRAAAFNATDTAWIQLMIPMNERARLLTGLAPSRTADPAPADLAARTGTRLERELADLRAPLDLSGTPDTRPHEGHDMPGMVGLDTLRKAEKAKGGAVREDPHRGPPRPPRTDRKTLRERTDLRRVRGGEGPGRDHRRERRPGTRPAHHDEPAVTGGGEQT